jgi:calmodulin
MSLLGQEFTIKELRSIMYHNSVNGEKKDYMTYDDFYFMMNNKVNYNISIESELGEAFKVFDREGKGYITSKELKYVLLKVANILNENEVKEVLKKVDVNGDNQIDYVEFLEGMIGK